MFYFTATISFSPRFFSRAPSRLHVFCSESIQILSVFIEMDCRLSNFSISFFLPPEKSTTRSYWLLSLFLLFFSKICDAVKFAIELKDAHVGAHMVKDVALSIFFLTIVCSDFFNKKYVISTTNSIVVIFIKLD